MYLRVVRLLVCDQDNTKLLSGFQRHLNEGWVLGPKWTLLTFDNFSEYYMDLYDVFRQLVSMSEYNEPINIWT